MRTLIIVLAAAASAALLPACDRRADAIRETLSAADRLVFDRGARATGECWTCHEIYSEQNKVGPGLLGIFGRRAGSLAGFGYSQEMQSSGIVWDERNMAAFLANGQSSIPGNRMVFSGIRDREQLRAVVFYLQRVTKP